MRASSALRRLDTIANDHPSLWGELAVTTGEGLQHWSDATLLPPRRRLGNQPWWRRYSYGVFDASGNHLRSLSDMRGPRHCCHPDPHLDSHHFQPDQLKEHELVLYGGSIYDQFGHLTLDSGRVYQLLRDYRDSDLPIWFHDATPKRHRGSTLNYPLVQAWFKQLGIRKRARLIRHPMRARQLVSCGALCSDRRFASRDLPAACAAALKPRLRDRLAAMAPTRRLAYLSRHKLSMGSTHYRQENDLVARLENLPHVDVICPEELNFKNKLRLYRRYEVIAGFPQACMALKLFVPGEPLAQQVMFVAGPRSLSSTWVNINRSMDWGDGYVDCNIQTDQPEAGAEDSSIPFQRSNSFDIDAVVQTIEQLSL